MFVFFILPKWGFYNKFLENHAWTATVFNILATQQTTFMFLITLLISINRYIAVKYPFSYELYFSKPKIVIILLSSIILSLVLGFGNIFFDLRYKKSNFLGYFTPSSKTKNEMYYQIFYLVILFGLISIMTCIFNVMAILTLKKINKIGSQYKKEIYFIVYSFFIFITLLFVEAFFVCKFIVIKNEIKSFSHTAYFIYIVAFDLTSVGDFYFLIYSCNELRKALKTTFGCSKKINNKITIKLTFRK
uniref:Serpentine receptor class gamma n=1 Tax=Strongyloides venezuelensis TaxID=75913 RepID=A0A0K0G5T2_STRVS